MGKPQYMTLDEAVQIVPVAKITLRRAIKSGDLTAYKIGRQLLVTPSDFEAWIESRRVNPAPAAISPPLDISRSAGRGRLLSQVLEQRRQQ